MSARSRSCAPIPLVLSQIASVLAACAAAPESADDAARQAAEDADSDAAVITVVLEDVAPVGEKLVALAQAFSNQQYAWRPGEDVRSTAEALMHVAAINYFFTAAAGIEPPSSKGLDPADPATFGTYEASIASRDSVLVELQASFEHLRSAIESTRSTDLDQQVQVFGQPGSLRRLWIAHAGHLHEHLGQLIAYARMNDVAPPWSQ